MDSPVLWALNVRQVIALTVLAAVLLPVRHVIHAVAVHALLLPIPIGEQIPTAVQALQTAVSVVLAGRAAAI